MERETFCFKIQKEMCIYKFIKIILFGLLSYYFSWENIDTLCYKLHTIHSSQWDVCYNEHSLILNMIHVFKWSLNFNFLFLPLWLSCMLLPQKVGKHLLNLYYAQYKNHFFKYSKRWKYKIIIFQNCTKRYGIIRDIKHTYKILFVSKIRNITTWKK